MDGRPEEGSVTISLERLKAGDPAAAKPLWDRYYARLVGLARGKLLSVPRAAADEEDIALSAFNSFWQGVQAGRFPHLHDRDDLWQVLFMLTARKAVGQIRHETREKRDARRRASGGSESVGDGLADLADAEPTPEFAAEVAEQCAHLLDLLRDDQLRQVARWKLEGYTNEEIGQKIGRSIPAVERKLATIRKIWTPEQRG